MEKKFNIQSKTITVEVDENGTPKHGKFGTSFHYDVELLANGCSFRCEYSGSVNDYKKNKAFDEKDINHVFECCLNDALAYIQYEDIDEFQDVFFGKSAKVSQVNEAYQKCKEVADWFKDVGIDETDLCNMLNSLNDE